jgi:hypothetical protein
MGIAVITLIIGAGSLAMAGIPDVNNCQVTRTDQTGVKAVIFVVPGEDANARFDEAYAWPNYPTVPIPQVGGLPPRLDATIEVIVKDGVTPPEFVANYPRQNITLVSAGVGTEPGMFACTAGNIADADTDEFGYTQFQNPLSVGGLSTGPMSVAILGSVIPGSVDIIFNSTDNNGDGKLDGVDLQAFTADYFSPVYNFRSDLEFDGIISGADLQKFAAFYFDRGC